MGLLSAVSSFFLMAIVAVSVENAIFFRGFGVSRLLKLVDDGTIDTLIFGGVLCIVEVIAGVFAYFANILIQTYVPEFWRTPITPLAMVCCTVISFLIVLFFCLGVLLRNAEMLKKGRICEVVAALPMAAFNCCVLGVLYITTTQQFTLIETIGFAIGSAIGYVLAVLLVSEGQRKMKGKEVPKSFKGLPINLIYIGILALAIYAFTGHMKWS